MSWKHSARVLAGLWLVLFGTLARAELTIEITQGTQAALPIAIVPFAWQGTGAAPAEDIARIIHEDLRSSGQFNPLPREAMLERPGEIGQVNYQSWRVLGMDNLVIGRVRAAGANQYTVEFQLLDALRGVSMMGLAIPVAGDELRRVAHHIADLIYEKLLGVRGVFNTRMAYVEVTAGTKPPQKNQYTLVVADIDGHNAQAILRSAQPVLSPAWSPDGQRLAYVSFERGRPAIYIQDVGTGARQTIAEFTGLNSAPAWSPDGRQLALTLSRDGQPDIYTLDLASKNLRRLTNSPAIDTEPVWTPDGQSILFTSDQGGAPQIYRIDVAGGGLQRVTYAGEYNARPRLSPDGRQLAVVHRNGGDYVIAVLDLASGSVRELTDGPLDESPSFAPNGSALLYATRDGGRDVLATVSVDGRVRRVLRLDTGAVREPAWAPFMGQP